MQTKKWIGIGLAVSLLSTAMVGCGGSESASGGSSNDVQELNLPLSDEVSTLDTSKATDSVSNRVNGQLFEGLVRLDKDGKAVPGVAKEWTTSADGLTYTFILRDNAKWSDGSAVTAHDFEYAWKRTLDPKTASQYAFMVAWIKGGADYNAGKGTAENVMVKAKDDKTLEVTLERPIPFFVEQTAFPTFYPQKKEVVEKFGKDYGADHDKAVYNGPFKLTNWTHEQSMVIEKNENYWDKDAVKLAKVNFQIVKDQGAMENLYQAGQLDRIGLVRDQVDRYKENKEEFRTVPELTTGYIQFNFKNPALANAKVRRALTFAIDGEKYADIIYHNGTSDATGLVPNGTSNGQGGDFRKDNGDLIKRKENVSKAKALLEEGLKEAGQTDLKLKLLIDDGDVGKKAGEFMKEQWRTNLGINVELEAVPFKLKLKRMKERDYDMGVALWGADYNDPMTFLDMWITNGDFNETGWSNAKYDELIKNAQIEKDAKKRMQYMYDAEKILIDEMPVGPIFFRASSVIMKPYVKGWQDNMSAPVFDLKGVYIEGKK
jgi:oligopeptide transport system substrate-binding protein